MANESNDCSLKRLFDKLYPTDFTFEYHSNSVNGAYIKVLLYNDLWILVYPHSEDSYEVVKHDYSAKPQDVTFYWSFEDLIQYLMMNYEG